MRNPIHRLRYRSLWAASAFFYALSLVTAWAPVSGADWTLTTSDGGGESSFGMPLVTNHWPIGGVSSGALIGTDNYFTGALTIRSNPTSASSTFGGNSLTLGTTGGSGASALLLISGPAGAVTTINDLRARGGSEIRVRNVGTNTLAGNLSISDAVTLNAVDGGAVGTARTLDVSAKITGSGDLFIDSTGIAGGVVVLSNSANAFTGNTTIRNKAILSMGAADALPHAPSNGDLIVNSGGTFRLAGKATTIQGLSGSGTAIVEDAGADATLTFQGDQGGVNNAFSGVIQNGSAGKLSLLMNASSSTNTQTLSGTNTYTGLTTISAGTLQIANNAALGGTGVGADTTVNGSGTLALSGGITSAEALTLVGRSDITAHISSVGGAGTNTLTGGVTLAAGEKFNLAAGTGTTLNINGPITTTALATGTHEINLSGAGTGTVAQAIGLFAAATNTLNKTDAGTWTLSGAVSNLDALNVSGGSLVLGSSIAVAGDMALSGTGTTLKVGGASASADGLTGTGGTLSGNGNSLALTLGANGVGTKTFSGSVADGTSGVLSLTKTGDNLQVLSGTNNYTGTTAISDGQLRLSGGASLGAGAGKITISGANSGTLELDSTGTKAQALDLTGRTSGTAHVNNLAGTNTLSGVITLVESDTPSTTPDNYNFNVTAGTLTVSQGVVIGTESDTNPINLNLSGGAGTGNMGAVNLTSAGSLVNTIEKTGAGTWTLDGATTNVQDINAKAGTLVFNNAGVAYSGTATIDSGATLQQGVAGAFDGKVIEVNGALDLTGMAASLPGLNGSGTVTNSGSSAVLTINGGGSFSGDINDGGSGKAVSLTKEGAGTQVLSGAGDYTGQTTIKAGTLEIQSNSALGDPAITVIEGSGTLALRNGITTAESLALVGRGSDTPAHIDNAAGNNTLSATSVTLRSSGGGTDNFNLSSSAGDLAIGGTINGTSEIAASTTNVLNVGGVGNGTVTGAVSMQSSATANTLTKTGLGTWTLNGAVTNLTALNAEEGTLELGSNIVVAGDIDVDGTLHLKGTNATAQGLTGAGFLHNAAASPSLVTLGGNGAGTKDFSGIIDDDTGVVALTKVGDNLQILSGVAPNNYSGLTTISAGTLEIQKDTGLGTATDSADGTIVNGSGVLALSGNITSGEHLTLAGRGTTPVAVTSSGNNTLSGSITLTAGTDRYFDLASTAGTLTVSGPIIANNTNGNVSLAFMGPADTTVSGLIDLTDATGEHKVYALDTGSKTIGSVDLSGGGGELRIGNEGGGNLTITGNANLSGATGASSSAGLRNYDSGTLTAGNVDLSDADGGAYVTNRDGGQVVVTGTLQMQSATGSSAITNQGGGSISIAGADMSGASSAAQVTNSSGGSITVAGVLDMSGSGSAGSAVANAGSGTLLIQNEVLMTGSAGPTTVLNTGAGGILTVDGKLTDVAEAGATAGTFVIGASADVSDVNTFLVASGAVIDATAVLSGFHLEAGQTLKGGGQVKGNITADGSSIINIGSSPGTLTITGNLTLAATSLVNVEIDVAGTGDDFLAVSGLLTLSAGSIFNFIPNVALDGLAHVFASYGSLAFTGAAGCGDIGLIPTGFHLDCAYGGNQLALVNETPVPAPLFLIGLGALALGASRRYAKW